MTKNITSRDWETLSAYLDGYLSLAERQQLEARLLRSGELKNGLEELRRTRQVLRSQPRLRAPRNFTLTAQMVGVQPPRRQPAPAFPFLRLASVFASILLVLVVAGDLLTAPNYQIAQLDAANRAVEMAAPQAPEAGEVEAPAPEPQPFSEKGFEPQATSPGPMAMMAAPTEAAPTEAAMATSAEPAAALALPSGGGQPPEEQQLGEQGPEEQALAEQTTEDQSTDMAGIAAPTETPAPMVASMPAQVEEPVSTAPNRTTRAYWRAAEILLALIAISSGLVAYYLRKAPL